MSEEPRGFAADALFLVVVQSAIAFFCGALSCAGVPVIGAGSGWIAALVGPMALKAVNGVPTFDVSTSRQLAAVASVPLGFSAGLFGALGVRQSETVLGQLYLSAKFGLFATVPLGLFFGFITYLILVNRQPSP